MRRLLALVAAATVFVGCSGGSGDVATTSAGTDSSSVVTDPGPTVSEPPATEPPATEPPATEPPETEPPPTDPPVTSPLADVASITVTEVTPGDRPRFTWDEVDGAVEYSLVVATDDQVIWAWRGATTSIDLGAGLIDGNEGPRLAPGATLDVFALTDDGTILAASGPVPLTP